MANSLLTDTHPDVVSCLSETSLNAAKAFSIQMNTSKIFSKQIIPLPLILLLSGCSGDYTWGWYVVDPTKLAGQNNIQFLIGGLSDTIQMSVVAIFISMTTGLLVCLPGISSNKYLRAINMAYVAVFRSIPVLVMILWTYYGLPVALGIDLGLFAAGVIALAICDSPFQAEIFRAGIQSIDIGQHEAAESMGLTYFQKMRLIILPQAIRKIIPPLANQFVYMLKMSSLASVIGYSELTRRATELVVNEYRQLEIYSFLILEYLVLILVVTYFVRKLENYLKRNERIQNPKSAKS
ncbi:amino acid ABC transporter permease [Kiloniella sp. EL199]|uniref:amino acid ABC transporter permease n=1 Tax=Kiloniella sp. EL199 TaxID=2107581 RepID=UPI0020B14A29|nr:amino acid ABC transporter permease [Kiloniella sp. EL199]